MSRSAAVVWLWLAGCSAAPSPDAGLVDAGVDAGAPADSGVDAGSDGGTDAGDDAGVVDFDPDGGPREPTFATQVLFGDTFESYASTMVLKATYGDQREIGGAFSLDTTSAGSGVKSLKVDYGPDAGCADADVFLSRLLAITSPQTVVAQYRFRFDRGFEFARPVSHCVGRGSFSTELVIGRVTNAPGRVVLAAASGVDGVRWQVQVQDLRGGVTPSTPHATYRQSQRFVRRGPAAVADGAWHRLSLLVQRETQAGLGDGVVRVWIDGEAVIDRDGAQGGGVYSGTAPFGSLTFPSVLPAGATRAQARWFDEVTLFEP